MKVESIKCDKCGHIHQLRDENYVRVTGSLIIGDQYLVTTKVVDNKNIDHHYCIGCLKNLLNTTRVRGVGCDNLITEHNEDGPVKTVDKPLGTMICGGDSGIPSNPNPPPPPPKWPQSRLFKEDGFGGSKEITGQERRDLGL